MIKSNLHTHTTLSDGRNTVAENVEAALGAGFVSLGISDHSYVEGDTGTVGKDAEERYVGAIRTEAERYAGRIDVFAGLEFDRFSPCRRELYDYVIGSVHLIDCGGRLCQIDWGHEFVKWVTDEFFGGDVLKLCEEYFRTLAEHVKENRPDIVGHFDVIALSSGVDEDDPRYIEMATGCAAEIMKWCTRFEVNTGAMGRGDRDKPYPFRPVLEEIKKRGGTVIPSSDCHDAFNINFGFDEVEKLLRSVGFTSVDRLTKDGFVSDPI
ncbi:MAG: hypothetical protein IKI03_10730 [Clostridia bacterium]|nr:hypothetical protein [Clostridia bacterium]